MKTKHYWLCCGDQNPTHPKERLGECYERKIGYPEHCHFGTVKEHRFWQDNYYLDLE